MNLAEEWFINSSTWMSGDYIHDEFDRSFFHEEIKVNKVQQYGIKLLFTNAKKTIQIYYDNKRLNWPYSTSVITLLNVPLLLIFVDVGNTTCFVSSELMRTLDYSIG